MAAPPKEFRIFVKGVNKTTKGDFLFDDKAAKSVMAEYEARAIEIMIDLEHLSLDDAAPNFDPDARGWCKLELRKGELWAVDVRWTPDGEKRLRETRQRYVSPAFGLEEGTNRVQSIHNIAICAVPATYETPALVAASARAKTKIAALAVEVKMDPELKKAAQALGLGDDAKVEDVLSAIAALQEAVAAAKAKASDGGEEEPGKEEPEDDAEEVTKALSAVSEKTRAKVIAALSVGASLTKELADLKKQSRKHEVDALIAANASKLTPALEAWARKQQPDALREYLASAPEQKKAAHVAPGGGGGGGSEEVKLTESDLKVARLTGTDPAKVLEHKKKLAAARAEKGA